MSHVTARPAMFAVLALIGCGDTSNDPEQEAALRWVDSAPLLSGRERHTAVAVEGGVLVIGGDPSGGEGRGVAEPLFAVEHWAAGSAAWGSEGYLDYARGGHASVVLADGRALVIGGCCDGMIDDEPSEYASVVAWTPGDAALSTVAPMPLARDNHTATRLPDGRVLVVGGERFRGAARYKLDSVQLYSPSTNTWSTASPLSAVRDKHTATLLPDGRVLILAGDWYAGIIGELWDPATDRWTPIADNGRPRVAHTATVLEDGRVLVVGGEWNSPGEGMVNADVYDPVTDEWTEARPLARGRTGHTASLLADGRVLIAGGCCDLEPGQALATTEVYAPATDTWTAGPPMAVRRAQHTATTLEDGTILVVGGGDAATKTTTRITQVLTQD